MASQDNKATSKPGNKINHLSSSLQLCYHYHCRAVLHHTYPEKFLTMWIQKAKSTAEYSPLSKKDLIVCTEQREALSAFDSCSSTLWRKVGWGACKPPSCSSHWSCSANNPSSSHLFPQQKYLWAWRHNPKQHRAEREGGFTISCKWGWENQPRVMGWASRRQLHPGFAALYSLHKKNKNMQAPLKVSLSVLASQALHSQVSLPS